MGRAGLITGAGKPGRLIRTAVTFAAVALLTAGCGGGAPGGGSAEESAETTSDTQSQVAEPPSETVPGGGDGSDVEPAGEGAENEIAEEAASSPEACPDVPVTADSGSGLFDVEVHGLTCTDATTALRAWGEAGFPGDGPEGFVCERIAENPDGSTRLHCTQGAAGGVLEFATGS